MASHTATPLTRTGLDQRAVDTARVLAMDAVQNVGQGHPGTAMSLAPAAHALFQGIATAVGMAMAARYELGLYDPEAPGGASVFDHTIGAIVSDGDLEEGVLAEASSLAGPQRLGNLVALRDDNHISIEVDTEGFAARRTADPERAAVFDRITVDEHSSLLPEDNPLPSADPYGRTVHFRIREHAMSAAMNGIALHGNTRTHGGRDGHRLARDSAARRRPVRTRPHPAERADLPGRRRCGQGRIRDA